LSETFLILRRSDRFMTRYVYWSSFKVLVILVRFEWNLNFFDIFSKKSNTKFHKNHSSYSWAVPCGETDRTKLIVVFRNVVNKPKKSLCINIWQWGYGFILSLFFAKCQFNLSFYLWDSLQLQCTYLYVLSLNQNKVQQSLGNPDPGNSDPPDNSDNFGPTIAPSFPPMIR